MTLVRSATALLSGFLEVVMAEGRNLANDRVERTGQAVFMHSARTAVVVVASLLVAQRFRLPESYWAPITTLVITQSSLGAALTGSWQHFIGTVLGSVVGAIVASYFGPHALVFGICVFILGLTRAVTHLDVNAYRIGGVTLAIVLLVPRAGPAWQIGIHRFAEVSIGIGVALLLAVVWPEREDIALGDKVNSSSVEKGIVARDRSQTNLDWSGFMEEKELACAVP